MGSSAIQRDPAFAGLENSGWFNGFFFLNHFGTLSLFSPLLSRFAGPAFLHLGRDSPNLDVLGLSMFASLGRAAAASPSVLPEKPHPTAAGPRGGLCHSSA